VTGIDHWLRSFNQRVLGSSPSAPTKMIKWLATNVAARLQGGADPGGIMISGAVHDLVPRQARCRL
jgi:hypothetical protein